MSKIFLIVTLITVAIFMGIIVYLLKRQKIYLKYALLWMFTGLVMLVLAVFPQILNPVFNLLGIKVYLNGIFAILIFFVLLILMSLTCIVSNLNQKNRRLVQEVALLEKRVRELEKSEKDQ